MQKITFEDLPSTNTPINANNLNAIQTNVESAIGDVQTEVDDISATIITNEKVVFKDLIGVVKTTATSDYSTSVQGFLPFVSTGSYSVDNLLGNNLTWATKNVSFEDVTGTTYGIQIPAGISLLKVEANVRYQNNASSQININTMIFRDRNNSSTSLRAMSQSVPASGRYTCNFGSYVPVQEGDFIYIGSWKSTASANVSVSNVDNATGVMLEVLEYE